MNEPLLFFIEHRPLFIASEFFKLPEADLDEIGITPLVSRHQPAGFIDGDGRWWVAIFTDGGLKRQQR